MKHVKMYAVWQESQATMGTLFENSFCYELPNSLHLNLMKNILILYLKDDHQNITELTQFITKWPYLIAHIQWKMFKNYKVDCCLLSENNNLQSFTIATHSFLHDRRTKGYKVIHKQWKIIDICQLTYKGKRKWFWKTCNNSL